jgi:hypothetical protein
MVKHLIGSMGKKVRSVKDKNGQLQTNTDKILESCSEHYKEKFENTREWNTRETQSEHKQELEDIDGTDIEMAVQKMKNRRAVGIDGIFPDLIKAGGKVVIRQMDELFKTVWDEERIPEEWLKNVIILVHKKGATSNCKNYGAICLSSTVFKAFTRILENRLRRLVEE